MEPKPKGYISDDPKKARVRKAVETRIRKRENDMASILTERGWTVISPYDEQGNKKSKEH
jgi:hypothetical protein